LITTIFSDHNPVEKFGDLSGDDAQTLIDMLDEASFHMISHSKGKWINLDLNLHFFNQVLDSLTPQIRRRCLHYLYGICGGQALLPQSLVIPLCYDPTKHPVCSGGYADVWKCQYHGREVAAKVLRVYQIDDLGIRRVSCLWCF
jgi:hypothetical protein